LRIVLRAIEDEGLITHSDYQTEYVSFLVSLAEQGADAIEVGNEPNIGWNAEILTPAEYTALLCEAYSAIKEANPNTLVISGAPMPSAYFGGCSPTGCDDLTWLQGLAEAGAADCLDFIGARHIEGATAPGEESGHPVGNVHHSWYFWPTVERYYEIFGGTRRLAFTMFGYLSPGGYGKLPDAFLWAANTTAANQAAWISEAVQLSIGSGKVGMIVIYNMDSTEWGGYRIGGGYAIMRPNDSCPTCEALRQLLSQQ